MFLLSGESKEKRISGKSRRRDKSRSRSPRDSKTKNDDNSDLPFDPTNLDKVYPLLIFLKQYSTIDNFTIY